ncbi:hypothetical protein AMQ84_15000 [Paenibacillus riograndensis]|uniref:Helix-turn-helix conjugative transposon-like domain-containing protein n=1 Tax=Paenibacillus riograndensis TaxID=483937 RepID=A0A132TZA8_9BACL|nr:hypothetical protein [Paenibacillus riograndensis]KWX76642.1 hypothetical protein AMQ84_15000 [Paenibacillus riograndensis]KWX89433.1 hypothetical protein AMQ83_00600 [Paenibacillus riograndensis]
MEKENDSNIISDREFLTLLQAAKRKDPAATLQLVNLFKEDILKVSRYIHLPAEDAVSMITLEFLELIQGDNHDSIQDEKHG